MTEGQGFNPGFFAWRVKGRLNWNGIHDLSNGVLPDVTVFVSCTLSWGRALASSTGSLLPALVSARLSPSLGCLVASASLSGRWNHEDADAPQLGVQAADAYLTGVLSAAAAGVASEPIPDILEEVRKGTHARRLVNSKTLETSTLEAVV